MDEKKFLNTLNLTWLRNEKGGATKQDIARLKKGEHVDYVIGWVDFLGCKIDLSKKPFIPRPETEFWVKQAIEDIKQYSQDGRLVRVLDMFAGSGCIGVAVAKHCKSANVHFAEKQTRFCEQIRINGGKHVIQSDMFENITEKYDYILANPPYVAENATVQQSVLDNEPREALFAGEDGLAHIKRFLQEAPKYLNPGGKMFMEFSPEQKDVITALCGNCEFYRDQYNRWRYLMQRFPHEHG